eukprot:scaffold84408_cov33-Tisochrysis_lutea.AAC.3
MRASTTALTLDNARREIVERVTKDKCACQCLASGTPWQEGRRALEGPGAMQHARLTSKNERDRSAKSSSSARGFR